MWAFVVAEPEAELDPEELADAVAAVLGKPFRPERVVLCRRPAANPVAEDPAPGRSARSRSARTRATSPRSRTRRRSRRSRAAVVMTSRTDRRPPPADQAHLRRRRHVHRRRALRRRRPGRDRQGDDHPAEPGRRAVRRRSAAPAPSSDSSVAELLGSSRAVRLRDHAGDQRDPRGQDRPHRAALHGGLPGRPRRAARAARCIPTTSAAPSPIPTCRAG